MTKLIVTTVSVTTVSVTTVSVTTVSVTVVTDTTVAGFKGIAAFRIPIYTRPMSIRCIDCRRPLPQCICHLIQPRQTGNRFLILIHPKEMKEQRTGTGHMTKKSLDCCDTVMGIDFTENHIVNRFLSDPQYSPILLYPGPATLKVPDLAQGKGPSGPWRFILIDGTWAWAKKMIRLSRNLHDLAKLSFSGSYRSEYGFKRQPALECLSTMETVYYLIKELEEEGLEKPIPSMDGFLAPFKAMIDCQLHCQEKAPLTESLRKRPGIPRSKLRYARNRDKSQ